MTRVAIAGAGGAVGEAIALSLIAAGATVRAGLRTPRPQAEARLTAAGAEIVRADVTSGPDVAALLEGADAAVFTPILTISAAALPRLAGRRAVFFSSNNVAVAPQDAKYAALAAAEARIRAAAPRAAILRPTLIYGDARLANIPRLMALMRRMPLMPVPGSGRALQQPLFFEDLARVAAHAALNGELAGRTLALGGPETLNLRDFYRAVSHAAGGARLLVPAPRWLLAGVRRFGLPLPIRADEIARADLDKRARAIDPLPAALAPRIGLEEGLARLVA